MSSPTLDMLNGCSPTTLRMVLRSSLGSGRLRRLYEQGLTRVAESSTGIKGDTRAIEEAKEQSGGTDNKGTTN